LCSHRGDDGVAVVAMVMRVVVAVTLVLVIFVVLAVVIVVTSECVRTSVSSVQHS